MGRSRNRLLVARVGIASMCAVMLSTHGCSGDSLDTESSALTDDTSTQFWIPPNGTNHYLPICFVTPSQFGGFDAGVTHQILYGQSALSAQQAFRYAFERTWPSVMWLDTGGFTTCPTSGGTRYKRVAISDNTTVGTSADGMGPTWYEYPLPTTPFASEQFLWVGAGGLNAAEAWTPAFAATVAHETGHAVGWDHENSSPYNYDSQGNAIGPNSKPGCGEPTTGGPITSRTALTPLDWNSIMLWGKCDLPMPPGLSAYDITGGQSVYGARPESGDVDHDGSSDLVDSCPYVYNKDQSNKNWDAELTVATRDNLWTGTVVNGQTRPEGHVPLSDDPQWYKDRWHGWYRGDACDSTGVTGALQQSYQSNVQVENGCYDIYVGGITSKNFNAQAACPVMILDGRFDLDSSISSATGIRASEFGFSQSVACKCLVATTSKSDCTQPLQGSCAFARDADFPAGTDNQWYRLTSEMNLGSWQPYLGQQVHTTFQPPVPGFTPDVQTMLWNPFVSSNWQYQDVARMGLGSGATTVSAVIWTGVRYLSATKPDNLPNNYIGVRTQKVPGNIMHWIPYFAPKWKPVAWWGKAVRKTWGAIRFGAVSQDRGGRGFVVEQNTGVLSDATYRFEENALTALGLVASGAREMIVADDDVASGNQFSTKPSVLIVDTGTTTIRGALTATTDRVTYASASVPTQSTASLRAYGSEDGSLYSLEPSSAGWTFAARDVARALAGTNVSTIHPVSGVVPQSPQAVVWSAGQKRLLVLDRGTGGSWGLRLLSIDSSGTSTELWETAPTSDYPLQTFASLGGFGEFVLSYNLRDGSYEVASFRADDGQPLQSLRGTGVLHQAAVSDGSGFTLPLTVVATEQRPNVVTSYVARTSTTVGACGTVYFKGLVGDQSTGVLGTPAQDCQ